MNHTVCPSFSGTPGAGDTIQKVFVFDFDIKLCPYLGKKAIYTYQDLLSQGAIDTRVKERLQKIKRALKNVYANEVDPIQYLMYLYYKEGLGMKDVNKRLDTLGVAYNSIKSIGNLFVQTFAWELRDKQERTPIQERKMRSPNFIPTRAMKKHWDNRLDEYRNKFNTSCQDILSSTPSVLRVFDALEFKNIRSNTKKCLYLLEIYQGITLAMLYEIKQGAGIDGITTFAHLLNQKLEEIHENNQEIPLLKIGQSGLFYEMQKLENHYKITPLPQSSSPS